MTIVRTLADILQGSGIERRVSVKAPMIMMYTPTLSCSDHELDDKQSWSAGYDLLAHQTIASVIFCSSILKECRSADMIASTQQRALCNLTQDASTVVRKKITSSHQKTGYAVDVTRESRLWQLGRSIATDAIQEDLTVPNSTLLFVKSFQLTSICR
jgi:hypothetical protein